MKQSVLTAETLESRILYSGAQAPVAEQVMLPAMPLFAEELFGVLDDDYGNEELPAEKEAADEIPVLLTSFNNLSIDEAAELRKIQNGIRTMSTDEPSGESHKFADFGPDYSYTGTTL